jgi:diacylglycerol kinase family enzyme
VALIAAGHARSVDIGEVNGETFINNASIGVYPFLVLERERRRRRSRLSKWAAMLMASWRVLKRLPLGKLSISAGGEAEPCRSPCVLVGNNAYHFAMPALGRRERLDAGELWLYIAKAQRPLALLWLVARTALGRADHLRELRVLTARSAEIGSRQKRIVIALDGEVAVLRPPLQFRTRPGALRVFGPAAPP